MVIFSSHFSGEVCIDDKLGKTAENMCNEWPCTPPIMQSKRTNSHCVVCVRIKVLFWIAYVCTVMWLLTGCGQHTNIHLAHGIISWEVWKADTVNCSLQNDKQENVSRSGMWIMAVSRVEKLWVSWLILTELLNYHNAGLDRNLLFHIWSAFHSQAIVTKLHKCSAQQFTVF